MYLCVCFSYICCNMEIYIYYFSLCYLCLKLVWLCVMDVVGCIFIKYMYACVCVRACVCVCVCVFACVRLRAQYPSHSLWSLRGSFPPALPPVSVLLRPQGYNDCRTLQICSSSPSDRLACLKSGSHFRSQNRSELDSLHFS